MRYLAGNAQHIGARHSQQDSFGFSDPDNAAFVAHGGFLAVVCDGMGGMEYGDAASRTAVRAFLDAYLQKTPVESIPQALFRSVEEANRQVLALAASLGLIEGVGTTLVATALIDGSMFYVSVGDSGLFHATGSDLRMVNRPHIFANVLDAAVAQGTMSPADAASHPERESLTSYIGAQQLHEIDFNAEPYPLGEDDVILLASDGLFKTLSIDEMRASRTELPDAWPEALVAATLAKQREYQDNVTVLSVAIESVRTAAIPRTAAPATKRQVEVPLQELPKTVRMSPAPAAPAPAWTPPVQAPPAPRKRSMLIPILVLLALIAAGAGWWYVRTHPRLMKPEVTDPGAGVKEKRVPNPPPPPPEQRSNVKPEGKEPK
jgi:protein phosphatase